MVFSLLQMLLKTSQGSRDANPPAFTSRSRLPGQDVHISIFHDLTADSTSALF